MGSLRFGSVHAGACGCHQRRSVLRPLRVDRSTPDAVLCRTTRLSGVRLRGVTADDGDLAQQRAAWERRRRRSRRLQDLGLALLALGVLVLAYVALTYSPS